MGAIIMKISYGTFTQGTKFRNDKRKTPNWAKPLGQGKKYKINNDSEIEEVLKGIVHLSVPLERVSTIMGKDKHKVCGNDENSPIVLAGCFNQVYINDILIEGEKFILLLIRDTGTHSGRLQFKFSPENRYLENGKEYSNENFIRQMKLQLGLAEDACWFVYDMSVIEQEKLVLKTIIVNENGSAEYENDDERRALWEKLEKEAFNINNAMKCTKPKNRIVFGAPGTGKSYKLEKDSKVFEDRKERVTFHPNYSYANFVGTYKPVVGENEKDIAYKYVPGPFMRIYVEALNHPNEQYLLLIEEINRANVAAVFGDVFQLLDRKNGKSEYNIVTSEDVRKFLAEELDDNTEERCNYMCIPDNMFIWATMNSADQGVFPMDTAFKRRWEFEYLSVNDDEQVVAIKDYKIPMCILENKASYYVDWNGIRTGINNILTDKCKVNEDKLLGPFFIFKNMLDEIKNIKAKIDEVGAKDESSRTEDDNNVLKELHKKEEEFIKAFESKVIMYLFEDVMKMRPENIFIGHHKNNGKMIFSEICKAFEQDGEGIFGIGDLEHI